MQRTLTIDGLDSATYDRLESEARRRGLEVPALARELLQQSVDASVANHHDLDALAGTWSEEEADAFEASTAGMRHVDAEMWR